MEQADCPASPSKHDKMTVGEELFLVHLSRFAEERSPEDYDREKPIHSATSDRTVGEELWQIHCQRMKGIELDDDDDDDDEGEDKEDEDESSSSDLMEHDVDGTAASSGTPKRTKKNAIKAKRRVNHGSPIQRPRRILTLRSGKHVRVSLT